MQIKSGPNDYLNIGLSFLNANENLPLLLYYSDEETYR
jgi:hypothetical protein